MSELNIYQKLQEIQLTMEVPKDQWNDYGKYHYRSLDNILNHFKPYAKNYGLMLTLTDDVKVVGQSFYLESVATLVDMCSGEVMTTKGVVRIADSKKGMDDSQICAAASSYARKIALNGMFLLG